MFADFRQNIQFALRIRCKILPIEIQVRKFKSQFKFYLVLHVISHCKVYLMVNLVLWGIAVSLCRITVHLHDVSSQEEYGVSFQEVYDESYIASYKRLLYETL